MIRFLTYLSATIIILVVVTLCHAFILYLIDHPMPFKITVWIVAIIFFFKCLEMAVKGLLQSDWLDNTFKSKSVEE